MPKFRFGLTSKASSDYSMTYAEREQNAGNYDNNIPNIELKINPKYEIQTRPYTSSEYKRLRDSVMEAKGTHRDR